MLNDRNDDGPYTNVVQIQRRGFPHCLDVLIDDAELADWPVIAGRLDPLAAAGITAGLNCTPDVTEGV